MLERLNTHSLRINEEHSVIEDDLNEGNNNICKAKYDHVSLDVSRV